jgi:hypothetical protein
MVTKAIDSICYMLNWWIYSFLTKLKLHPIQIFRSYTRDNDLGQCRGQETKLLKAMYVKKSGVWMII